jgi:hypothetical protein
VTGALAIVWSPIYLPAWDETPQAYVDAGTMAPGRSRRLAKITHARHDFKAYLGVRHFEPARWNLPGEPTTTFFASFFIAGRTVALRTFPTLSDALATVVTFADALAKR